MSHNDDDTADTDYQSREEDANEPVANLKEESAKRE